MTDPDVSLWQALGIPVGDALDHVPDDVWASAVQHAVDPSTPESDSSLVPEMDDSDPDPFADSGGVSLCSRQAPKLALVLYARGRGASVGSTLLD